MSSVKPARSGPRKGLLDDVFGPDGRRIPWCSRGVPPVLHLNRSWDTYFGTLPLFPSEKRAFPPPSPLGDVAFGYLAWRRSVLCVYLPVLAVGVALSVVHLCAEYGQSIDNFLAVYYDDSWPVLSLAADQLTGPYYVSLGRDIVIVVAAALSAVWLGLSLLAWNSFRLSARRLRVAFFLAFVAPFLTTAVFSTNEAVQWGAVLRTICITQLESQLEQVVPSSSGDATQKIAAIVRLVCNSSTISAGFEAVPTQASLLRLIEEKGLLSNSTADSQFCRPPPSLDRSPLAAATGRRRLAQPRARWLRGSVGRRLQAQEHWPPPPRMPWEFHDHQEAHDYLDGLLERHERQWPGWSSGNGSDHDGDHNGDHGGDHGFPFGPPGGPFGPNRSYFAPPAGFNGSWIPCGLRSQIAGTGLISAALRTSTSAMLTIGTATITQSWSTILNLGPTVLGFALGVGRGTMLSKLLLPSSRLPALFAAFAVFVGLPLVAAFAAFLVQLTQSSWLSASLICLLMALSTWMPLGLVPVDKLARAPPQQGAGFGAQLTGAVKAYLDARKLRYPIRHEEASRLYDGRRYAYYVYITLSLGFFVAYLFSDNLFGAIMRHSFVDYFEAIGTQWGPALLATQTLCETCANMYIAQTAYCDGTVQILGHANLKDQADPPEVVRDREEEFRQIAELLATGGGSRSDDGPGGASREYAGGRLVEKVNSSSAVCRA